MTPESILGCILGGAIGDALGSACEGGLAGKPELTDDTQLTLATCEALTGAAASPERIARSLLSWYRARRVTRMGSSTLKALRDLDAGAHWALAGCRGERAAGNGAAMRIAPLAFRVDSHTGPGRQLVREVCRITHHHEEAYVGALAILLAICHPAATLQEIAAHLPDTVVRDRLYLLHTASNIQEAAKNGTSGYVADSVPFALFASRQLPRLCFAVMLQEVIAAGGDTDTNASLAGQVAGASLGLSRLPQELLEGLPDRRWIEDIATRFAAT